MNCVDAGNVLVHLFLQTKTHYVLTNKKLQYLLIIAQMSRLSCGSVLFEDDIRNFKYGFVLDIIGNTFMTGSEITSGKAVDKPIDCDVSDFVLPYTKRLIYEISQMPSDDDRDLLIKVFLAFGAYNENTLGRFLGEFATLRKLPMFSVVPKSNISRYFSAAFTKDDLSYNAVFSFIKEQYLKNQKASVGTELAPVTETTPDPERAQKMEEAHKPTADTVLVPESTPSSQPAAETEVVAKPQPETSSMPELITKSTTIPVAVQETAPEAEALPLVEEKVPVTEESISDVHDEQPSPKQAERQEQDWESGSSEPVQAQEEHVLAAQSVLKDVASLQSIIAGKKYSILVEVPSPKCECQICVVSVDTNQEVPVSRVMLTDTLYSFSFDGVASDIKVSAQIVNSI